MTEIDTPPFVILPGEKRLKGGSKRLGRKLSKLADAWPAKVLSESEHKDHCRRCQKAIPAIVAKRNAIDKTVDANAARYLRHRLQDALRALVIPLYGIRFNSEPTTLWFVSANCLSDYKREGIDLEVVAMPVLHRIGSRGINTRDVNIAYIETFAASRGNAHAMGKAQDAWRYAHLEKDKDAETVAYFWLYHGNLKPCKDEQCKACGNHRRLQAREISALAFRYLGLDECNALDSRKQGKRPLPMHRMRSPTKDELSLAFQGWREA